MAEKDNDFSDIEDDDELSIHFALASKHVQKLASKLEQQILLQLYSYYKQATVGDCDVERPSWYKMQEKMKWNAWNEVKGVDKITAMEKYIDIVSSIDPDFKIDKEPTKKETWVSVSTLGKTDSIVNAEKTISDFVKDSDTETVEKLLNGFDKNSLDSDGLGLIHWAADRGAIDMMNFLIKHGFDVNLKDKDGQSALHYAVGCDYLEICKILIQHGADVNSSDLEGTKVIDLCSNDKIKSLLM